MRYQSDKHFSEFLPTRWRQKSTGIDMEQNYVTVTLCIAQPSSSGDQNSNTSGMLKNARTSLSSETRFKTVVA